MNWTGILHEALIAADRLHVHNVVDIPVEMLFKDEWDSTYAGIGPDGAFEKDPVFCIAGANKIVELLERIRIDDQRSGGHCMCTGWPWLRFFRHGTEIASFTLHHGVRLRWHDGPWPDDGALTEDAVNAIPAWFLAEGLTLLHQERQSEIAASQRKREEYERFIADLPAEIRAELQETTEGEP